MSGAVSTGDTRTYGPPDPAPSQLLAVCLAVSLALHAVVLWLLPEWNRETVIAPTPVLDVVMVSNVPDAPTVPPRQLQQELPTPMTSQRQPVAREPVRIEKEIPMLLTQPDAVAPSRISVPVEHPVAEANPAALPRTEPITAPEFSAAYLRNPPPRYPPAARRNGDEGRVMLKVLVSPAGVPVRVEVDQSSGSPPLDSAALDAVKAWRFVPARRGVQNVEAWVRVPVVFRLES